jgi:hypothetical protein
MHRRHGRGRGVGAQQQFEMARSIVHPHDSCHESREGPAGSGFKVVEIALKSPKAI